MKSSFLIEHLMPARFQDSLNKSRALYPTIRRSKREDLQAVPVSLTIRGLISKLHDLQSNLTFRTEQTQWTRKFFAAAFPH